MQKTIETMGIIGLTGVLAVTLMQVILRYVFKSPVTWAEEIARLFEAWVIFLGSYIALRKGVHVSVDFFVKMMPRTTQRVITICTNVLVLAFLAAVFIGSISLIQNVWGTLSTAAEYPAPIFPAAVAFGMLTMFIELLRQTVLLIRGRDVGILASPEAEEEGK